LNFSFFARRDNAHSPMIFDFCRLKSDFPGKPFKSVGSHRYGVFTLILWLLFEIFAKTSSLWSVRPVPQWQGKLWI
jgi:hypothetical protein